MFLRKGVSGISNFLAIVEREFVARDLETQGFQETEEFRWCKFGEWPSPLHFGFKAVLNDPHSIHVMQQAAGGG